MLNNGENQPATHPTLDVNEEMDRFLQDNPQLREALEIFGITITEYDRLLANLQPLKTTTTNVTSAVGFGN
jgi:hypothetical protein